MQNFRVATGALPAAPLATGNAAAGARIDQENYALKNVCQAVNATKTKMGATHPMAFKGCSFPSLRNHCALEAEFPKGCRLKPYTFLCTALVWSKRPPIARVTLDRTRSANAFHVGPETS
jgi:hypothetical protein